MKIGQLAARTQTNAKKIRYYEHIGMLSRARRNPSSNYREFSEESANILAFIKSARQLGFTLLETRLVLREHSKGKPILSRLREAISAKARKVRKRIEELARLERRLRNRKSEAVEAARKLER